VPAHDLTGMPAVLPALSDQQYRFPKLVGRMHDNVILSGDALRSLEDAWCEYARRSLLRTGDVVRPLRVAQAAEIARAAARAAGDLDDGGSGSTQLANCGWHQGLALFCAVILVTHKRKLL
jgi:hypothetical protein